MNSPIISSELNRLFVNDSVKYLTGSFSALVCRYCRWAFWLQVHVGCMVKSTISAYLIYNSEKLEQVQAAEGDRTLGDEKLLEHH